MYASFYLLYMFIRGSVRVGIDLDASLSFRSQRATSKCSLCRISYVFFFFLSL